MISKVFGGHSFYHACRYICLKQGATILETEGVRGHNHRLMSDDFKLSERGKRWIKALRAHYKADMIDAGSLDINELYEADGFKML